MRGADALVETIARSGADVVFSLSGNQIMPVYDACVDAGVRIVHTRHEAACVFMADAWAQLTGKVGVALVTAAPGFGNALGALYSARASESPVLFLSGDAPLAQAGRGAFQEFDQLSASAPFTKRSMRADGAATLGATAALALDIARSGRPGPVHLALPFDVVQAEAGEPGAAGADPASPGEASAQPEDVEAVRSALAAAASPLVLLGPLFNAVRAPGLAERLSAATGAPVIPMESPRGLNDPALGRLAGALAGADLVVTLGKRVDFTLGFGSEKVSSPSCRWLVVDAEEGEIARARLNLGARLERAMRADPKAMAEALCGGTTEGPDRGAWRKSVSELLRARNFASAEALPADAITPLAIARAVEQAMAACAEPILVCDGGEFGQWAQSALPTSSRVINGPSGAIGGGLCFALGARAARPNATVFSLMGDGTIGFHLAEFETAAREKLPFVAVIGNDQRWNAEHQIQLRDYGADRLIGCELSGARYDLAVAGLGGHGEHVTELGGLGPALERAARSGLPACVNVEMQGLAAPIVAGH